MGTDDSLGARGELPGGIRGQTLDGPSPPPHNEHKFNDEQMFT